MCAEQLELVSLDSDINPLNRRSTLVSAAIPAELHRSREARQWIYHNASLARYKYVHSHRRTFDDLRSARPATNGIYIVNLRSWAEPVRSRASDGAPLETNGRFGAATLGSAVQRRADAPKGARGRAAGNWFSVSEERTNCQTVTSPS